MMSSIETGSNSPLVRLTVAEEQRDKATKVVYEAIDDAGLFVSQQD